MSIFGSGIMAGGIREDSILRQESGSGDVKYLYTALGPNGLIALDVDTGKVIQTIEINYAAATALPDGRGVAATLTHPYRVTALDPSFENPYTVMENPSWQYGQTKDLVMSLDGGGFYLLTPRFLVKINAEGLEEWATELLSGNSSYRAERLTVGVSGYVYVCGKSTGTRWRVGRWKVSEDGEIIWGYDGRGSGAEQSHWGRSIAVDEKLGRVFIGSHSGTLFVFDTISGSMLEKIQGDDDDFDRIHDSTGARLDNKNTLYMIAGNSIIRWRVSSGEPSLVDVYTSGGSGRILDLAPLPGGGIVYMNSRKYIRHISDDLELLWHTSLDVLWISETGTIACYPGRYDTFPTAWP